MRPFIRCASLFLSLIGGSTAAHAAVIADSVADFSSVQGGNNWYYGYYDGTSALPWTPADFKQLTTYYTVPGDAPQNIWSLNRGVGGTWTFISKDTQHPNGRVTSSGRLAVEQWAVRRWVSPVAGTITLTGRVADAAPEPPDSFRNGVIARIFADSSLIWTGDLAEGNTTGLNYSLTQSVSVGSVIDFAVDPRVSTDYADWTVFTVTITPEPASFALLALPTLFCLRRRLSR